MINQTISHYKILEKLGGGGMGVVYKARDIKLDRYVAVKFLSSQFSDMKDEKQRFIQEAKAAASLDHNNICTIYEIDETENGQLFICMAYYEGETLKRKISSGQISVSSVIEIASQIATGLAKAHEQGIVHRDIKPANIMVTIDGVVKIVDFGLAKLASGTRLTKTGATMGIVAYMSPEQAHGEKVDHRTDIWSFGVVLYEILTGQLPFKGEFEQAIIYSILNKETEPIRELRSDVPMELEWIVKKTLEKDCDARYQHISDLLPDLKREQKSTTQTWNMKRAPLAGVRKNRKIAFGLAGMLILTSIFMLLMIIPSFRYFVLPDSAPKQPRLAVLPFRVIGEARVNVVLSQGLFYTVTTLLTKEPFHDFVQVIPANEVLDAGITKTRQADSTFGVNRTMFGNIEHSGNTVSLTLTLVDATSLTGLNSVIINAQQKNILAYQDEMVKKLAELLGVELNQASVRILTAGGTREPGAYEFFLQGQGYLQQFTNEAKVDIAISMFERAIARDSSYALAYAGLSEACLRKYERTKEKAWIDKAFQYGEQAIALDSLVSPVHITRGMYYNIRGRYDNAEVAFRQALKLEPNNAAVYRELAIVYEKLNKLDLAEENYKKAIELKLEDWIGYNKLGMFYEKERRHEEAIEQYLHVIKLAPDIAWGYYNLGVQHHYLRRFNEAVKWYKKAIEIKPENIEVTVNATYSLGGIYYEQDNFLEAIRMYAKILAIRENDMWGWQMLANANFFAGKKDSARVAWKQAISHAKERLEVNISDPEALKILVCAHAMLGEREQSDTAIYRLLALDRKDADLFLQIGVAYEALGERDSALQYIEKFLKNDSNLKYLEGLHWLDNLLSDPRYQALIQKEE